MNFFKVEGRWITPRQMREWRAKQKLKDLVKCDWCITQGIRHSKWCPTLNINFDPETPKLTFVEREQLMKQKNGTNDSKK